MGKYSFEGAADGKGGKRDRAPVGSHVVEIENVFVKNDFQESEISEALIIEFTIQGQEYSDFVRMDRKSWKRQQDFGHIMRFVRAATDAETREQVSDEFDRITGQDNPLCGLKMQLDVRSNNNGFAEYRWVGTIADAPAATPRERALADGWKVHPDNAAFAYKGHGALSWEELEREYGSV